jgi:hypothetical protein
MRLADALRIDLPVAFNLRAGQASYGAAVRIIATGEPWSRADVFLLEDALRRGIPANDVAGFLGRTADEVQAKARELGKTASARHTPARM